MKLHFKSPGEKPGIYPIAERGRDLKHLSFRIVELGGNLKEYRFETDGEECSLDFYTGPVGIEVEGPLGKWQGHSARRDSIASPHAMAYIPPDSRVTLRALDDTARVTIGSSPSTAKAGPALVDPVMTNQVGKDNWTRTVFTHIADNIAAQRLICGETLNRPGGWSSCPPHKHDRFAPPNEVPMEEIYYFQVDPHQGFGFMRIYTAPGDENGFDESYAVEHGDTVLIPRGYHPVVACPGYTLNYTWILAGEGRAYGAWSDDPRHAWIKQ